MADIYEERTYRRLVHSHLSHLRICVQETDLSIHARSVTADALRETIIEQRGYIESYSRANPGFIDALEPWPHDSLAPVIVREMIAAGQHAGVGPMAAVAGAMAQMVGYELAKANDEFIVENGGDIYLSAHRDLNVAVFAGSSPLSLKVALRIVPSQCPLAICTSSATVGHSVSFGNADAVCVVSKSCALADAAATAIGNHIDCPEDIQSAIDWGKRIPDIRGIVIIIEDKMGMWGEIELAAPASSCETL